jgi:anti-repressor protein
MGFTGEKAAKFKEDYINAFNQMEQTIRNGGFTVPSTFREALLLAAEQQEVIESQQRLLTEQAPKVRFAEAVTGADTNILMRDLAKLICQSGVNVGEVRLYEWMVNNKYLIRRTRWSNKKQRYEADYTPTQIAADLKVFFMTENVITVGESSFIKHTVKITPKGQQYFINKFITVELQPYETGKD